MTGLPCAFVSRVKRQLGGDADMFLAALDEPYVRGARLRADRISPEMLESEITGAVPWAKDAYRIRRYSGLGLSVFHEAGAFYLQEPSAMIPVSVLAPKPGEYVLDLCAAPGGKATQAAALMNGEGLLVANDPVPGRAQVLSGNIERMGITNAIVVCAQPRELASRWRGGFDAVLVDAPCSGEGMFRRHPEAALEWSEESAAGCAKRQSEILDAAAELVRPGGRLVYSTCTFAPAENGDNVDMFLSRHPDFRAVAFEVPGAGRAENGRMTFYPHLIAGEGQFAALLRKTGGSGAFLPEDGRAERADRSDKALCAEFAPAMPEPVFRLRGTLISVPFLPDVRGLRVFRAGLHIGENRNGRLVPDHALALCARPPEAERAELDESSALGYFSGDVTESSGKGWVIVCCHGVPLGWGKISDGKIKNHLPKGLRKCLTSVSGCCTISPASIGSVSPGNY